MKSVHFDEKFITENQIAVIFVLVDWARATYEVDFLKKCWFGDGVLVSKIIIHFANGVGFGKWHFRRESKKVRRRK